MKTRGKTRLWSLIFSSTLLVVSLCLVFTWIYFLMHFSWISTYQMIGYMMFFGQLGLNFIQFSAAIYWVTVKKKNILVMTILAWSLLLPILLNIATIIFVPNFLMREDATKQYILQYYKTRKKLPPLMDMIQIAHDCCGVSGYEDYLLVNKEAVLFNKQVPDSCCLKEFRKEKDCAVDRLFINMNGCFEIKGNRSATAVAWDTPYEGTGFFWVMILPMVIFVLQVVTSLMYHSAYHYSKRALTDEFLIVENTNQPKEPTAEEKAEIEKAARDFEQTSSKDEESDDRDRDSIGRDRDSRERGRDRRRDRDRHRRRHPKYDNRTQLRIDFPPSRETRERDQRQDDRDQDY